VQELLRDPEIAKILQSQCMNMEIQGDEYELLSGQTEPDHDD